VRDPVPALGGRGVSLSTAGAAETERLGESLAAVLVPGDVLLLSGELGAGKTTLVRGVARGLGVRHGVKSPSFAIHLRYPGRLPLHHLDLYRVLDPRDLLELGVDDLFGADAVTVVEWGERLGDLRPEEALAIALSDPGGDSREFTFTGPEEIMERIAPVLRGFAPDGGER
jgi:tRNA threonylcarbamoyladenosine biosynthesis protein TsaE